MTTIYLNPEQLQLYKLARSLKPGQAIAADFSRLPEPKVETTHSGGPPAVSRSDELDDDSEMPFGKNKGKRLGSMNEGYFEWFLTNSWAADWPAVKVYAEKRLGREQQPDQATDEEGLPF